ncbi:unnamed protein product [Danaus chrysippus]|uniref:(African queen) hypothetical protein n=1 Tax=Danaus chrysippus TaxID=151541 RepID=A0A8J2R2Y4_9NEOP|nr:unnamed protein product [Danaus chrysippus]
MFQNGDSNYPGNTQGFPNSDQSKPLYQEPSKPLNNFNPADNYPEYPPNGYQSGRPQYERPSGINNIYQGNNPGYSRPGNYQIRPNQINNPQGNVWNNANENPGMNYPGGTPFFPGNSAQNPQYQRPGGGFTGNPSNGVPAYYRPRPGMGSNWINRKPNVKYDPDVQEPQVMGWNPNVYPNNAYPNQINVPGNQMQTQGVRPGFDHRNPGLNQGQTIQYPSGDSHNYRPGFQNVGLFNPSQRPNGLNNQLPSLQYTPNFDQNLNYPDPKNSDLNRNRQNKTEKVTIPARPSDISLQTVHKSPSRMKQCVQDCPTTSDYSPRCGSDNVTYFNEEKFQCSLKCGFDSCQRLGWVYSKRKTGQVVNKLVFNSLVFLENTVLVLMLLQAM